MKKINSVFLMNCGTEKSLSVSDSVYKILSGFGVIFPDSVSDCDAVISVGGDGTVLKGAKIASSALKPILGINAGRIGYITSLEGSDLSYISRIVNGDYNIDSRMMIEASVVRNGVESQPSVALNDIMISRDTVSRLLATDVTFNGQTISYSANGVVFSTPTGSTAYSFSAGGAIIDTTLDAIAVTPVCARPSQGYKLVLSADTVLSVKSGVAEGKTSYLVCDGEKREEITSEDTVLIRRSSLKTDFITFRDTQFNVRTDKLD